MDRSENNNGWLLVWGKTTNQEVVWNMFYISIYWQFHQPNGIICFRGVDTTNENM